MPTRKKEEAVKVKDWLAKSQGEQQTEPYSDADEMAPNGTLDTAASGRSKLLIDDWESSLAQLSRGTLSGSSSVRIETLQEIDDLAEAGDEGESRSSPTRGIVLELTCPLLFQQV